MNLQKIKNLENKHILLKNVDSETLGILHPIDIKLNLRDNDVSILEFKIYKNMCPYYDLITSYRRIEVEDIELFIIDKPQIINDGVDEYKIISGRSFEIDINRKNIPLLQNTYKFYSINPEEETILSIIMSYLPNWSIKEIDSQLWNLYRTFDLQNIPLLQLLRDNIQNSYECVFEFNGLTREISVRAYENIPKKTDVYLSLNNLVNELQLTEKTEEIFTALTVFGAGENLSINLVNPTGSTIYNFNHFLNEDGFMSDIFKNRIIEWQNEIDIQQPIYANHLVNRRTKLSELITLQTELTELNSQLKSLEITRDALLDSGLSAVSKNNEVKAKRIEIVNKKIAVDDKQTEIDNIDNQLQIIQNSLSLNGFFTTSEFLEIEPFVIQTSITDENFVITSEDDELAKQETAQALYDKYKNLLEDKSKLKYEFAVDIINFLPYEQYNTFINQLQWGSQVTLQVNDDGDVVYPMLLGLDIDWNDNIDIKYLFSTEVKLSDSIMDYDDFSNEVSNMSNKMAGDSVKWSQYVNSGDKDRIFDLFSKGLQADLTEIKNASNQNLVINELGLLARKQVSENIYEDEQLKIMNNRLAITRNGWDSLATVVGKVTLPDGSIGFGVNTDVLMGKWILANQATIVNANNTFSVDSAGVRLTDATFLITKGLNKILLDPTNGFKIQKNINNVFTDMIYLDVDGNAVFKGNINASEISGSTLIGGSINIGNGNFTVDNSGNLVAKSGTFTGTITASNFNQGEINGSSINIGDGNFTVDIGGNVNLLGNIRMGGNITWDSPVVQYQYSTNNVSWHTTMTSNDKYRRESWDGGITWQTGYQFVGIDGINGVNGQDGSDANIPAWVQSYTSTAEFNTYIDNKWVISMNLYGSKIFGGEYLDNYGKGRLVLNPNNSSSRNADLYLYSGSNVAFKIYDNITGSIELSSYDNNFLTTGVTGTTIRGNWDFGLANINWGSNAPVAKFG